MANNNVITLVGNITDDPELRFTPGGAAVANFTVAVNQRRPNQDGGWDDKLDGFFRCNCWREMAENVAESLQKGSRVVVVGRLQQRSWEDQEGNKRSVVEVQVDEVGPSLRWATATVTKSNRSTGGGSPDGGRGGSGDWQQRGGGQGARGGGQGTGGDWGAPTPVGAPDEGGF
jgi:single-strand DNA-binding protein